MGNKSSSGDPHQVGNVKSAKPLSSSEVKGSSRRLQLNYIRGLPPYAASELVAFLVEWDVLNKIAKPLISIITEYAHQPAILLPAIDVPVYNLKHDGPVMKIPAQTCINITRLRISPLVD